MLTSSGKDSDWRRFDSRWSKFLEAAALGPSDGKLGIMRTAVPHH